MTPIQFPDWDIELFLYLNGKHTEALNPVMAAISSYTFWTLTFLFIAAVMIWRNKYWGARASIFLLLGIGVNSLINNILKVIILRPRPGSNESISDVIHLLEKADSSYSFFSAHSSNSFCMAVFTALYFKNKYFRIAILIWATVVAYSRIYVGRHYPLDVIVGILFGLMTGYISYKYYAKYKAKKLVPDTAKDE